MANVKTVLGNDESFISGLYGPCEEWQITVGPKVDLIAAYLEDGDTVWLAIYHAGKITQRVNARYVECVVYG